jgi:hypothetical protein
MSVARRAGVGLLAVFTAAVLLWVLASLSVSFYLSVTDTPFLPGGAAISAGLLFVVLAVGRFTLRHARRVGGDTSNAILRVSLTMLAVSFVVGMALAFLAIGS